MKRRTLYRVVWVNPETDKEEIYQRALSRARAERLSRDLSHGFGARWFGSNPKTRVEEDR